MNKPDRAVRRVHLLVNGQAVQLIQGKYRRQRAKEQLTK